jgi:cytosine/adenosine deaminase-related metal-dependent hydrolase
MLPQRKFKTGEWVLAGEQILNQKGEVYLEVGESACLMVFDPSKGETPNCIRKPDTYINAVWVSEAQLAKDPSKAHLTPKS